MQNNLLLWKIVFLSCCFLTLRSSQTTKATESNKSASKNVVESFLLRHEMGRWFVRQICNKKAIVEFANFFKNEQRNELEKSGTKLYGKLCLAVVSEDSFPDDFDVFKAELTGIFAFIRPKIFVALKNLQNKFVLNVKQSKILGNNEKSFEGSPEVIKSDKACENDNLHKHSANCKENGAIRKNSPIEIDLSKTISSKNEAKTDRNVGFIGAKQNSIYKTTNAIDFVEMILGWLAQSKIDLSAERSELLTKTIASAFGTAICFFDSNQIFMQFLDEMTEKIRKITPNAPKNIEKSNNFREKSANFSNFYENPSGEHRTNRRQRRDLEDWLEKRRLFLSIVFVCLLIVGILLSIIGSFPGDRNILIGGVLISVLSFISFIVLQVMSLIMKYFSSLFNF